MTSEETPNPGTKEATEQGCTCPVLDNNKGQGVYYNEEQFIYTEWCLVHGWE